MWPRIPGAETFRGVQVHSSQYRCADEFRGLKVAVVGGGNSGAQIMAEVSRPGMAASALWCTLDPPSFLPKGLTGKEIFDTGEPVIVIIMLGKTSLFCFTVAPCFGVLLLCSEVGADGDNLNLVWFLLTIFRGAETLSWSAGSVSSGC